MKPRFRGRVDRNARATEVAGFGWMVANPEIIPVVRCYWAFSHNARPKNSPREILRRGVES